MIMWPDWKARQAELLDKAGYFDFMKRPTAAEWLRLLAEKVESQTSRKMLQKFLDETFVAWISDFSAGNSLRKRRLEEISKIMLSSVVRGKLSHELRYVIPMMREIGENLENLTPLGMAFAPFRIKGNHKMSFYGMCYHYPLLIEGVFDESIRLLYLLISIGKGKTISLAAIEKMPLKDLKQRFRALGLPDIFFQGWENRVRNSIAHARFRYDDKRGMMHFIDIDPWGRLPDYSRWFTFNDFSELGTQASDIYTIIQDTIFMLRIQQLVLYTKVPNLGQDLLMPDIRRGVSAGILKDPNA